MPSYQLLASKSTIIIYCYSLSKDRTSGLFSFFRFKRILQKKMTIKVEAPMPIGEIPSNETVAEMQRSITITTTE